jgi:amino acid permease
MAMYEFVAFTSLFTLYMVARLVQTQRGRESPRVDGETVGQDGRHVLVLLIFFFLFILCVGMVQL